MDPLAVLKAQIESKKRQAESAPKAENGASAEGKAKKVYLTKGQIKQQKMQMKVDTSSANEDANHSGSGKVLSPEAKKEQEQAAARRWIPKDEVVRRLRALEHPITLFGETDEERIVRLRQIELATAEEEDRETAVGQKNFHLEEQKKEKQKLEQGDSSEEDDLSPEEKKAKKISKLQKLREIEDAQAKKYEESQTVTTKCDLIKAFLKKALKEWEIDIDELPESVTKSVAGRQELNQYKQTKVYLKPLFKGLKKRNLDGGIMERLARIVMHSRRRQYTKAADDYLLLAIGKAAWPMGVTMVGIHERSAREKIFSADVAHVLNDETTRKFVQSVKRLVTYMQNKYPPDSFTDALEPTAIDKHAPTMLKSLGKAEIDGIYSDKHLHVPGHR